MKFKLVLLPFLSALFALGQTYNFSLRITRPNRDNLLTWTNQICANVPVYQVLRVTNIIQTNWQHFLYVTNAASTPFVPLPGRITDCSESTFYRLRWVSDTPMTFSYEFDEGYGLGPCVTGTLIISLANLPTAGTWQFQEGGFCVDGYHPTGNGNLLGFFDSYTVAPHHIRLYLSQGPEASYLDAFLQSTVVNGTCMYTGMVGTVVQGGIISNDIGPFTARRTQ